MRGNGPHYVGIYWYFSDCASYLRARVQTPAPWKGLAPGTQRLIGQGRVARRLRRHYLTL